ncbi:protein PBDC1 isoform X2 [Amphiprion ocellaris]|uniref:Polysaccharide biosynthesis domain-containing protein n=1 Tax=Amphiprion ocellaris TaxID=80972 RepID=A0A3Q1CC98_AMPOC|nr:protein PBDC1 isoform X2 [Amphiprion ocellaris]
MAEEALAALGVDGAAAAANALSLPAEAYGNDPRLEVMWAMKAYNHAEVYFNLISSVDPKFLKLTKLDDKIYSTFRESFKDLDLKVLTHDQLKSSNAKERWRLFCNQFEGLVEDFNFGTLLRLDCEKDYVEDNTVFATRIQFFAIEIARNREGLNNTVYMSNRSKSSSPQKPARTSPSLSPQTSTNHWNTSPKFCWTSSASPQKKCCHLPDEGAF